MKKYIIISYLYILLLFNLNSEPLIFGCDQSESSFAEHNKKSTLIGNAYVKTETIDINSDRIELYGKDYRFADCTGNVVVYNKKDNFYINSEKLFYDNEKKEVTVTGNAVMKDIKNEMVIKGEYIKSFETTSITIIQIKVRIINEDLVCRSEYAEYNSDLNRLILKGDPIVYKGDDIFRASKITINLDSNDIIMEGKVKGNISEDKGKSSES